MLESQTLLATLCWYSKPQKSRSREYFRIGFYRVFECETDRKLLTRYSFWLKKLLNETLSCLFFSLKSSMRKVDDCETDSKFGNRYFSWLLKNFRTSWKFVLLMFFLWKVVQCFENGVNLIFHNFFNKSSKFETSFIQQADFRRPTKNATIYQQSCSCKLRTTKDTQ